MTEEAKVTGTDAHVAVSWRLSVQVEPGSVPDRPHPHSRKGATYRPETLQLEFTAAQSGTALADLCPEAGDIRMYRAAIAGGQLRRDGSPGLNTVTEQFYGSRTDMPDWAQAITDAELAALKANAL